MPGKFKVKSKVNLDQCEVGAELPESDFCTLTPSGNFVQLEYIEEESKPRSITVKPGIWSIVSTYAGLNLSKTQFTNDRMLDSFLHTKDIEAKIDSFFSRLHIYREYGFDIPKRTMLFYGPAGSGKTSLINKACNKYVEAGNTAIVIWRTDRHEPYDVKQLFKSFKYEGVERIILIAEDLGGIEMDQIRIKSESSLLALLDNQEKTFTLPTLIMITTNYPENFLGNLMNRPQRIDDKIEVGLPDKESRKQLFQFFARPGQDVTEDILKIVESRRCEDFTPAHIKEVFIRSAIYELPLEQSIHMISDEIAQYKNAFTKKTKLGISKASTFDDFE